MADTIRTNPPRVGSGGIATRGTAAIVRMAPAAPVRIPGSRPEVADPERFEPQGRLAQFMRMVDAFERDEVESAVDRLIALLDERDGDPDLEDGGDADTNNAEDELLTGGVEANVSGAGCSLSDPGDHSYPDNLAQGYYLQSSSAGEDDEPSNRDLVAHQRLRIQATRCTSYIYRGLRRFELRPPVATPSFGRGA